MGFIFDESQLIDQAQNRNILRWQKLHITPKRDKSAAHIMLINIIINEFANRSEALKLLWLFKFHFRGIEDHKVSLMHSLQRCCFTVIRLDESASHTSL